ncbi:MAG: DUF1501 domain-containing protein [Planctomycetes bacterium]|nr:DUF1501 domain-containing protein [Planctomycetota bacterium]
MTHHYQCNGPDHTLSRRRMLGALAGGGVAASTLGIDGLLRPAVAEDMKSKQRQVLFIWLDGAMSQLESWDPKPHTEFGGPFRAIPTSVPGLRISELLPHTAKQMHRLSLVRNLHTVFEDHSRAVKPIQRGDPKNRGVTYPFLGSAVAKFLGPGESRLPPYLHIKPGSGGFHYQDAGFLGARYGAIALGDGKPPSHMTRPKSITDEADAARNALRQKLNQRFRKGRREAEIDAYDYSFSSAQQLMKRKDLFDPSKLTAKDQERYGTHQFGRHLLQARRLLEAGVTFVKVTMYYWDTHADNFNLHADLLAQFDRPFAAIMDDLSDAGMLEHTTVIVLSEFGRTPKISQKVGRDHFPEAWSMCMGGAGLAQGAVVGKTNAKGTWIEGEEYDIGHVFHTIFRAIGIDPAKTEYDNNGQPLPLANEDCGPIKELLV